MPSQKILDLLREEGETFQVVYEDNKGVTHTCCMADMCYEEAEEMLERFKEQYLNADGTGKAYPNGKGYYPFFNPRIIDTSEQ